MGDSIKKLRKALGLTQQEFADRLGVSRNNIATYETGKSNPGDAVLTLICREFDVNEEWLRTGEGEMFVERDREEELAYFFGQVLREENSSYRKRLFVAMSRLESRDWEDIERVLIKLAGNTEKD